MAVTYIDAARIHCGLWLLIFLDATLAVREAVREGAGLSVLPDCTIGTDFATGRLIQMLPQWSLPAGGIYAAFPSARFRPARFAPLLTYW